MISVKKKRILICSDGTVVPNKTLIKSPNKIKILNKDHKTFLLNQKNNVTEHDSKDLKSFKVKFLKS